MMTEKRLRRIAGSILAGSLAISAGYSAGSQERSIRIESTGSLERSPERSSGLPRCAEDETLLVGRGDFENGRYESYACLHPEDLTAASRRRGDIGRGVQESVCEHGRFWARRYGIGAVVSEACDR